MMIARKLAIDGFRQISIIGKSVIKKRFSFNIPLGISYASLLPATGQIFLNDQIKYN